MSDSPIAGHGVTVHQLFSGHRYRLGDYQREYSWSQHAVRSLLTDLHKRFAASWSEGHSRERTREYEPYFLGPYVYHEDDGYTYLVDGQQRFTTLHLLLIYVRRLLLDQDSDDASAIEPLIVTRRFGRRTYTIDIGERTDLLDALMDEVEYGLPEQASPSIRTMVDRFGDIDEFFPEELRGEQLPLFCDWLLERVCLVGIRATGRDNGWEIFESMNNRGVPLGPIDLLKSHLLHGSDPSHRPSLNENWRNMLADFAQLESDHENAASKFVKTMLIARYIDHSADSDDRDQVEKSFHEWVRSREKGRMGLKDRKDFEQTIRVFGEYAKRYQMLARASHHYASGGRRLRSLYFNRHNGLDFQFPLIFAALEDSDQQDEVKAKAAAVGTFLDCVYVRRIVNNDNSVDRLDFDTRSLIPRLRETRTVDDVRQVLGVAARELAPELSAIKQMTLAQNHRQVKYVLARLTAYVDEESGDNDRCDTYLGREQDFDRRQKFQIEHIWSKGSAHGNIENFELWRNRLGLLLLLPASDNASYRDDAYEKKLEQYFRQNWLAAALHPKAYVRNPGFRTFRQQRGLEDVFRPFPEEPAPGEIEDRQLLYYRLSQQVWDLDQFGVPAAVPECFTPSPKGRSLQTRKRYGISVGDLIDAGMVKVGDWLCGTRRSEEFWVQVLADGRLCTQDDRVHGSLSGAGQLVLGRRSCQGWYFWHKQWGDRMVPMGEIRQEAIDKGFLEPPVD